MLELLQASSTIILSINGFLFSYAFSSTRFLSSFLLKWSSPIQMAPKVIELTFPFNFFKSPKLHFQILSLTVIHLLLMWLTGSSLLDQDVFKGRSFPTKLCIVIWPTAISLSSCRVAVEDEISRDFWSSSCFMPSNFLSFVINAIPLYFDFKYAIVKHQFVKCAPYPTRNRL